MEEDTNMCETCAQRRKVRSVKPYTGDTYESVLAVDHRAPHVLERRSVDTNERTYFEDVRNPRVPWIWRRPTYPNNPYTRCIPPPPLTFNELGVPTLMEEQWGQGRHLEYGVVEPERYVQTPPPPPPYVPFPVARTPYIIVQQPYIVYEPRLVPSYSRSCHPRRRSMYYFQHPPNIRRYTGIPRI